MEKGTLIGLPVCFLAMIIGAVLKGANPVALITNAPALVIVILGSTAATMIAMSMKDTSNVMKYFKKALSPGPERDTREQIDQIVQLTNRARTEGLLALDDEAKNIDDPFFRRGIQMAVDGTDPAQLHAAMQAEVKALQERHKIGQQWFMQAGIFAPTFGIIGAVFGLMATMAHLDDPSKLGHSIAAAFVATFWGVYLANGVYLPLANKLKRLDQEEVAHMKLVIEGVLAIQAGTSPRVVEQSLLAHLPPGQRAAEDEKGEKAA
jgi:chemotaxis protein MotA